MLGRIKKGESVIGMRAVSIGGKFFRRGPALVRGRYAGKNEGLAYDADNKGQNLPLHGRQEDGLTTNKN
jgi:hypothetical protein